MQVHQHIPHGLLYSVSPQDIAQLRLSDHAVHDEFEWEEYESGSAEGSLAGNVLDFLRETDGE